MKALFAAFAAVLILASSVCAYTLSVHQTGGISESGLAYPTPRALYRFNGGNATSALQDTMGQCNLASDATGVTYPEIAGVTNGTVLMNQNNTYTYCSNTSSLYNLRSMTVDFYLYHNSTLSVGTCPGTPLTILNTYGGLIHIRSGDCSGQLISDGGLTNAINPTNSTLHRFTYSYYMPVNGSSFTNVTVYYDGSYVESAFKPFGINNSDGRYEIGGHTSAMGGGSSDVRYQGLLEEFAIYSGNLTPNQIDAYLDSASCLDGTSNQTCSTTNPANFCANQTITGSNLTIPVLQYNPNVCACPAGTMANGTSCGPSNVQAKLQVPIDLVIWDEASCVTDSGNSACSCQVVQNPFVTGGAPSCPSDRPPSLLLASDYVVAKYLATGDKKPIATNAQAQGQTNVIPVNSASCTLTSPLNPALNLAMSYNASIGRWVSPQITGYSASVVRVTCTSSIANSTIHADLFLQNTATNERSAVAYASSGVEPRLTGTVTNLDSPITFRYQIDRNVAATTYGSSACQLAAAFGSNPLWDTTVPSGCQAFANNLASGVARKTDATDQFTAYQTTVCNRITGAGDFPYIFACTADGTYQDLSGNQGWPKRQPSFSSVESLTVNTTCQGPTLTSTVNTAYDFYENTTQPTPQAAGHKAFWYGYNFIPSAIYQARNGSNIVVGTGEYADCTLLVGGITNSSFTAGPFRSDSLPFSTEFFFNSFADYQGQQVNYLPVGNYSFAYTCRSTDQRYCIAAETHSDTVEIQATPGSCSGTASSCGVNSCNSCGTQAFACEKASLYVSLACLSQTCRLDRQGAAGLCSQRNLQSYGVKLETDRSEYACNQAINARVSILNNSILAPTVNATCLVNAYQGTKLLLIGSGSAYKPYTTSNGVLSVSLPTGGDIACGQDVVVKATCDSPSFVGSHEAESLVTIDADTRCPYNGGYVRQGCVSQTTGKASDNPKYCSKDGTVLDNPVCGCQPGYELGSNLTVTQNGQVQGVCVQVSGKKSAENFLSWVLSLGQISVGFAVFLVVIWPFLGHFLEKTGILGALKSIFLPDSIFKRRED